MRARRANSPAEHSVVAALAVVALTTIGSTACRRSQAPASGTGGGGGAARAAGTDAVARTSGADSGDAGVSARDAAPARDTARPSADRVITIRVINAGDRAFNVYINEDVNEMIHTRRLFGRRNPDASGPNADGELVKFFPVGEMPLCSADAGAGYGGLGQPEIRALEPGAALEFHWDGWQRVETNIAGRGVCAEQVRPTPARYRFEFDQPGYGGRPMCQRPTVEMPLDADAGTPLVVEIRCQPPRPRDGGAE